jgi:hypothetical protein
VLRADADKPEIITRIIRPDPLKDDDLEDRKANLLSGSSRAVNIPLSFRQRELREKFSATASVKAVGGSG